MKKIALMGLLAILMLFGAACSNSTKNNDDIIIGNLAFRNLWGYEVEQSENTQIVHFGDAMQLLIYANPTSEVSEELIDTMKYDQHNSFCDYDDIVIMEDDTDFLGLDGLTTAFQHGMMYYAVMTFTDDEYIYTLSISAQPSSKGYNKNVKELRDFLKTLKPTY